MISCDGSRCLPENDRCDGIQQCQDGFDEHLCGKLGSSSSFIHFCLIIFFKLFGLHADSVGFNFRRRVSNFRIDLSSILHYVRNTSF